MLKIFVTGDNHIGRKFDRYPTVRDKLVQSRFVCLENMVLKAEAEACHLFVITGDLFDNVNTVKVADIKRVADILSKFSGTILVLPGNHDYYTGDEKVWKRFIEDIGETSANLIFLNEYAPVYFEAGEEEIAVYPAFCDSKHSKENKLSWIKKETIDRNIINIGLAHGALSGITPDLKEEYFLMSERELEGIAMDVWLLGHTHIPYPADLSDQDYKYGYRIFNPGTHAQTDLHNNTEGYGFIIEVSKDEGITKVGAKKFVSGKVRFFDIDISVSPKNDTALFDAVSGVISELSKESIIRLNISGSIKKSEYTSRKKTYENLLNSFLDYEVEDAELSEEISVNTIRDEYAETSFAAKFLEQLVDNSTELQMAYQLVSECKEV